MTYIPPELQDGPKNDPVPEDAGGDVPEVPHIIDEARKPVELPEVPPAVDNRG